MEFSKVLKQQRSAHNLSQEQLAEKLHIARQSISKWERGEAYPSIGMLLRLSEIFDISIDELLKGDDSLKGEIIKDGEKINHPRLKLFFDWLFLTGVVLMLGRIVLAILVNREIVDWDLSYFQGWLSSLTPLALMLVGGVASDELRKDVKR